MSVPGGPRDDGQTAPQGGAAPHAGPVLAWVGLGANLGDARATLARALADLAALPATTLQAWSSVWRTAPVQASGPDFLNAVARLSTGLAPEALLAALLAIERRHGRERPYHHAPRTLDLDLLMVGSQTWHSATLELPHPRLHERAFVLQPLLELDPDLHIPDRGPAAAWLPSVAAQRAVRDGILPGPRSGTAGGEGTPS